jgi:hypothetical protein
MAITEKGITPPTEPVMQWLQQLQLKFPSVHTFGETLTPSSVSANDDSTQTFTVNGLNVGPVVLNPPALAAGLSIAYCRVSSANTLQIRFRNHTGGALVPASGTYYIIQVRK